MTPPQVLPVQKVLPEQEVLLERGLRDLARASPPDPSGASDPAEAAKSRSGRSLVNSSRKLNRFASSADFERFRSCEASKGNTRTGLVTCLFHIQSMSYCCQIKPTIISLQNLLPKIWCHGLQCI